MWSDLASWEPQDEYDSAYELRDPKHETFRERMSDWAYLDRKRRKENPPIEPPDPEETLQLSAVPEYEFDFPEPPPQARAVNMGTARAHPLLRLSERENAVRKYPEASQPRGNCNTDSDWPQGVGHYRPAPRSESHKPLHKGCPLGDCYVSIDGWSDCLERACPGCGAQDLYEERCLVCGRKV